MTAARMVSVIDRTYRTSVQALWDRWTTSEGFESWWGPQGFHAEVRSLDARLDGTIAYELITDAPEAIAAMRSMGRPTSHPGHARYSVFVPQSELALISRVDFLPGVPAYDSRMAVRFETADEGARMIVTLDPMHEPTMSEMSRQGFESQLSKLDATYRIVRATLRMERA